MNIASPDGKTQTRDMYAIDIEGFCILCYGTKKGQT